MRTGTTPRTTDGANRGTTDDDGGTAVGSDGRTAPGSGRRAAPGSDRRAAPGSGRRATTRRALLAVVVAALAVSAVAVPASARLAAPTTDRVTPTTDGVTTVADAVTRAGDGATRAVDTHPAAVADNESTPETADGYLDAFRSLSGEPALSEYAELDVLRSRAVAALQVGTFGDRERRQMRYTLATMRSFVSAYEAAQAGDRRRSLRLADETGDAVTALRDAGATEYATLARLALERFYERQGDSLRARARNTTRTPEKIQLFEGAVQAYRDGNATGRLSSTSTNLERIAAEYRRDNRSLNASLAAVASFRASCDGRCDGAVTVAESFGVGTFSQYVAARRAVADATRARRLAAEHGLSGRVTRAEEQLAWARTALRSATLAAAGLLFGYALALGLVAALVVYRLTAWDADVAAANVGSILPREPLEVEK
ncbi:hypothetical protein RYH80_08205 [Halobaculum sp. MBLA0147]|uniref:hypothetical protein n=1 Tax=Halobaculum sp. MBLA0147 TaxID=3079934 RepID=UPI003524AC6E